MSTATFLTAFFGLFAMMNPIGNTGIFMSMTGDLPPSYKVRAAIKVTIYVIVILVGSVFGGVAILNAFGVSLPAFQLAGGLIVLGIGFKMLHGNENSSHTTDAGKQVIESLKDEEAKVNQALITPLAMPLLGGPGSIATVVTAAAAVPTLEGKIGAAVGTIALALIMGACFALSGVLGKYLTPHLQQIILRFMGMVLIAIAATMMLTGFQQSIGAGIEKMEPKVIDRAVETLKADGVGTTVETGDADKGGAKKAGAEKADTK